MYPILQRILIVLYAVLPVAAFTWAIYRSRKRKSAEPVISFIVTCLSGVILGTTIVVICAVILRGRVRVGQIFESWYFLIGFLCLMAAIRWTVREATWRALRVSRDAAGQPVNRSGVRASAAFLIQSVVLVAFGMPLIVGVLLTHRVRIYTTDTPQSLVDSDYEPARFSATDGVAVSGWWIPAIPQAAGAREKARWGHQTILMCGGPGDSLPRRAGLLGILLNDGFNVLAFDLRGQGDSGGHWSGFGDIERRDVLGALRWVKANHPEEARSVMGLGFGTGAAALIAAATDSSGEGAAIDALAVYGCYASFPAVAESFANDRLPKSLRSWALGPIIPVASAHAGGDLAQFAPAKLVEQLWPRPILIVHGRNDLAIPLDQGQELFRAATFPKQSLWLTGDHTSIYRSQYGAEVLLNFFRNARAIPAI
jgi:fermentation-respiration switch protein FrsA (DUF1100 family)